MGYMTPIEKYHKLADVYAILSNLRFMDSIMAQQAKKIVHELMLAAMEESKHG